MNLIDLICPICLETPIVPYNFKTNSNNFCSSNHIFCLECLYEYLRCNFQISCFVSKCFCPLDRTIYQLENISPESIFDIIIPNDIVYEQLDKEEIITCKICTTLNLHHNELKRKNYYEHWINVHYKNDNHLVSLAQPEINDDNYILLPPELTTVEEIERQRWIERCMQDERYAIQYSRIMLEKFNFFKKFKEIWLKCKNMRTNICLPLNIWKIEFDKLKNEIIEHMQDLDKYQSNRFFTTICATNFRTNHTIPNIDFSKKIKNNLVFRKCKNKFERIQLEQHNGDIFDYLKFIEIEKDNYDIEQQKKKGHYEKHKDIVLINKLKNNLNNESIHKLKRHRRRFNKINRNLELQREVITVPVVVGGVGNAE
ncbi:hypothetical protein BMW23_0620 [Bodo saltans virus]|uniref:RING-type domain-containing protein n=1 Tax=Bodo saltans virus TaxID=2024608 RepID=A0A2H4UUY6_9VIRU|nr:hypothetical protein QJ851_gp0603 [Bodo saltans virus]ATZ80666.1 hypothetical protein BMW23_0620 [Bodo saltans virus]